MNNTYAGEIKKDCFAFYQGSGGTYCKVLSDLVCRTDKCGFYKKVGTLCDSCNEKSFHMCESCMDARKHLKA